MTNEVLVFTAAMKQETETVTRCLENLRPVELPGCRAWQGSRDGITVLALQTGIGKERAERAMKSVIAKYRAVAVVSVGFGGALVPEQRAGEIIVCSETVCHDPAGPDSPTCYSAGEILLQRVNAIRNGYRNPWHTGKGVTIPVVAGADLKRQLRTDYGAEICEMEDAWLAAIADSNNLPFLAVRVILDELHDELVEYETLGSLLDVNGNVRPLKTVVHLLSHPSSAGLLWASFRNYRKARRNLYDFIKRFLGTYKGNGHKQ